MCRPLKSFLLLWSRHSVQTQRVRVKGIISKGPEDQDQLLCKTLPDTPSCSVPHHARSLSVPPFRFPAPHLMTVDTFLDCLSFQAREGPNSLPVASHLPPVKKIFFFISFFTLNRVSLVQHQLSGGTSAQTSHRKVASPVGGLAPQPSPCLPGCPPLCILPTVASQTWGTLLSLGPWTP